MTITNREEARAIMRQCESMERYLGRLSAALVPMEEEYNDLMTSLENFFLTPEQRKALDACEGKGYSNVAEAIRLGVDPDYAEWAFS